MSAIATETLIRPATEQLQDHFADLIWDADGAGTKLHEVERLWDEELPDTLQLTQGDVSGRLRRENVGLALGSLDGLHILVDLETNEGLRQVKLGLDGRKPRFSIRTLLEDDPVDRPQLTIEPQRPDYAILPVTEGFDWDKIIADGRATSRIISDAPLYLVVFRSHLKPGADTALLKQHDTYAHDAALESPALVHYFAGEPDEQGRALSFCLWTDIAEARAISRDSRHAAATKMINAYQSFSLEKYDLEHAGELEFTVHS